MRAPGASSRERWARAAAALAWLALLVGSAVGASLQDSEAPGVQDSMLATGDPSGPSYGGLALRHLPRARRQQQQAQQQQALLGGPPGGSGSGSPAAMARGPDPGQPGGPAMGPETGTSLEPPVEETLSSVRCEFGSADAPDLCKFRILDQLGPQGKGAPSWALGSGRLALFQGGPLVDASERNDTSGGYIFFETSSPLAGSGNQTQEPAAGPSLVLTKVQHQHQHFQNQQQQQQQHLSSVSNSFQQISSASVSVGPAQSSAGASAGGQPSMLGPVFVSPNMSAPGPSGMCLSFKYAIQGLSAEELRVLVNDHKTGRSRHLWTASESAASNWTRGEVLYSVMNTHSVSFGAGSFAGAAGLAAKEAQQRKFRGYIALDEIEINKHEALGGEGPCRGHCNFDGDLCGWSNADNGQDDDFDWSFGRGSDNLFTGPARDYVSSGNNEPTGSYLFIDSGFPRRPGDRAMLASPVFAETAVNEAKCMRFAVHMFGSGVGSLAIKIRYTDEAPPASGAQAGAPGEAASGGSSPAAAAKAAATAAGLAKPNSRGAGAAGAGGPNELVIWEMSGDAGNVWHHAQTSVSSSKSAFQVIIEGVVGENHLGNIAIDELSFASGPCPTSPPAASKNYGDCTFEQSMCYWRNPDAAIHLDDLDWIRSTDEQSIHGPNHDHTLKKRSGSYLKLEHTFREPKSGTRAFLLSPIFAPKESVQCLSFYYYMFMRSISSSGPNLGTIRVYLASNNELVPIWRLTNPISSPSWKHARASLSAAMLDGQPAPPTKLFQIAFEGIWGDAQGGAIALDDITVFDGACDIMPTEAKSVAGECTFDTDMCSWANKTLDMVAGQAMNPNTNAPSADNAEASTDANKSPFLQSVNTGNPAKQQQAHQAPIKSPKLSPGWQLATIDSRPVNLQDHTYKAPIGYAYVDVLDGASAMQTAFLLQSAESMFLQGQPAVSQCLSFWFAVFGRQDSNQLSVYLTQASAPPPPPPDDAGGASVGPQRLAGPAPAAGPAGATSGGPNTSGQPATGSVSAAAEAEAELANAWRHYNGKLLWTLALKNVTEPNRRKWQYGQVTLKADSNYIVRFVARSSDGGFALDDISYYEGACETRPAPARVPDDDEPPPQAPMQPKPAA